MSTEISPRELGARLAEARKAKGLTQEEVAERLGVARTTLVAIEKGERKVRPGELISMADLLGRTVNELVRSTRPSLPLSVQFRALAAVRPSLEQSELVAQFQRLCEDYIELERMVGTPGARHDPPLYSHQRMAPEIAAEDVADRERNRLGLGDGPVLKLRELLENDVGLRVFYLSMPSKVSGMFTYADELGGCVAVNRVHPPQRQRMSIAHEYGHLLTDRTRSEVTLLGEQARVPRSERFADAFARAFLMPAQGLRRRFRDLVESRNGSITPAELVLLADQFEVSFEALCRRLEELQLLRPGTWLGLKQAGFRPAEARQHLGLEASSQDQPLDLPPRFVALAVMAFERDLLGEAQLARFLRTDRLGAREVVRDFKERREMMEEGQEGQLHLNLSRAVQL